MQNWMSDVVVGLQERVCQHWVHIGFSGTFRSAGCHPHADVGSGQMPSYASRWIITHLCFRIRHHWINVHIWHWIFFLCIACLLAGHPSKVRAELIITTWDFDDLVRPHGTYCTSFNLRTGVFSLSKAQIHASSIKHKYAHHNGLMSSAQLIHLLQSGLLWWR